MEIINKTLKEIRPYANNPRKNQKAILLVANSIKEFGFKVPIVIDREGVIVAGHTRYLAAKKLRLKEVPCIIADDLTEEQVRAFRLADNKVGEKSEWNIDLLNIELDVLKDLDIDMGRFGFDVELPAFYGEESDEDDEDEDDEEDEDPEPEGSGDDEGYYGDVRERTFNHLRLYEFDPDRTSGRWQMPSLKRTTFVPDALIRFDFVRRDRGRHAKECGVHFFIDDYFFERIWVNPYKYIDKLRKYQCVLTPDFSLYSDMPVALNMYNVYRSRLIGQLMQRMGMTVIPTIQYGTPRDYEFCFDGIEKGSVIATSANGIMKDDDKDEALASWIDGMDEAIRKIEPSGIIMFGTGTEMNYDFRGVPVRRYQRGTLAELYIGKAID